MTTYAALTTAPDEGAAARLADGLEALDPVGVGAFEIEDGSGLWEVGGYFLAPPDAIGLSLLSAAHGAAEFVVSEVPERDWVAQVRRELAPVPEGRLVVHGAHDRDRIGPNRLSLEIEAAMAFGTGHHGTTQGCLRALDRLAKRGIIPRRVADIGCGTGVLAMASARLWPARIFAGDIDPTAVAATRANARANRVAPRVATGCGPGARHPRLRAMAPVDLVLANILARPLKRLAPEIAGVLAPGGLLVLSGLLTRQKNDVAGLYRCWGFQLADVIEIAGWSTLILRRGVRGRS